MGQENHFSQRHIKAALCGVKKNPRGQVEENMPLALRKSTNLMEIYWRTPQSVSGRKRVQRKSRERAVPTRETEFRREGSVKDSRKGSP